MIITYTGKEQCDILFQLVKIGVISGKKVAVFDNSITHDFFQIFANGLDKGQDLLEIGNLTVFNDYKVKKDETAFDYIFIYEGLYPRFSGFIDVSIIAPGYEKNEWKMIKPHVDKCRIERVKTILIMRNRVGKKLSDRYVTTQIGIKPDVFLRSDFDIKDYESYVALTHNRDQKFNRTGELFYIVSTVASEIYKMSEKEVKKIMGRKEGSKSW